MADHAAVAGLPVTAAAPLETWLAGRAATWLDPAAPGTVCLADALEAATACWPRTSPGPPSPGSGTLLFPLLYTRRPAVTPLAFHQLIDAAAEARRTGRKVLLLTVPGGRGGPHPDAARATAQIAAAFTDRGHPVSAAGDVSDQASAGHLISRAATTAFTRRAVDLPDLLTAAAADTLGSDQVCLSTGLRAGRNLARTGQLVPLARLHHPADPFAAAPAHAKRPPAGSDSLHATAFTLGLAHGAAPGQDPGGYLDELGTRLRPLWNQLRRQQLTGRQHAPAPAPLRITCARHQPGTPVAVPLFGAPALSEAATSLVAAAALAGPPALAVDDITPRWCYPSWPQDQVHARYGQLASRHGGSVTFLSALPGLPGLLQAALNHHTLAGLRAAAGPRSNRARGALTGWDAIHLAVMSVACTITGRTTIAVQAANLRQMAVLAPDTATLSITGTLTGGTATVPVSWLASPKENT
jgi:hypothetical protein